MQATSTRPTIEDILHAIQSVETNGYVGDAKYAAIGKPNSKGQKAYGRYQVMDYNIPVWTKEAIGQSLTPEQFRNNKFAQEAVAKYQLGKLYDQYGNVADVASVWFSGRPVSKAGNAKDVNGTTVPQYVKKVLASIPKAGQVAGAANATIIDSFGKKVYQSLQNIMGKNPALQYTRTSPQPAAGLAKPKMVKFPNIAMPGMQTQQPMPLKPQLQRMFTPNGRITTPFGAATAQEPFHPGVDIAAPKGTPIKSPVAGTVSFVDYGHQKGENNFGNNLIVTDANGDNHRYSHLNRGYVQQGQKVAANQPIGEFGDTGATYSPSGGDSTNLDYRITTAYGQYKNPMLYLKNTV